MDDTPTPWLIADAVKASDASVLWVWVSLLLGSAFVLVGGALFCS